MKPIPLINLKVENRESTLKIISNPIYGAGWHYIGQNIARNIRNDLRDRLDYLVPRWSLNYFYRNDPLVVGLLSKNRE